MYHDIVAKNWTIGKRIVQLDRHKNLRRGEIASTQGGGFTDATAEWGWVRGEELTRGTREKKKELLSAV